MEKKKIKLSEVTEQLFNQKQSSLAIEFFIDQLLISIVIVIVVFSKSVMHIELVPVSNIFVKVYVTCKLSYRI